DRLLRLPVIQHLPKLLRDLLGAPHVVSEHVRQIVGVLVFAAGAKRERFHHHEPGWAAHPDLTLRVLAANGLTAKRDLRSISECEPKAGSDDRGEIPFDVFETTRNISCGGRSDEEVDGHFGRTVDAPTLSCLIALVILVRMKLRLPKTLSELLISFVVED